MQTLYLLTKLIRLDKPIGIWLLWWPTAWALWLTTHGHHLALWGIFFTGTVIMRSAGCIINDLADRKIDIHVERTKTRPLASNRLSTKSAYIFLAVLLFSALLLAIQLPSQTMPLCILGLAIATLYPFCKRFFFFPQAILGIAFAMSIPIVYSATNMLNTRIEWCLLFVCALLWPMAYDTLYALTDHHDDAKIGIHSSALWLNDNALTFIISIEITVCVLLASLGFFINLRGVFWIILLSTFMALVISVIRCHNKSQYMQGFHYHHWAGAMLLFGFISASL